MADQILRATGEIVELRFVLIDATAAANEIADMHNALGFARVLLGETLTSALILASGLKTNGTIQTQFQFSGDLSLVAADATPMGLVRARLPLEEVLKIGEFEPLLSPLKMLVRKLDDQGRRIAESVVEMPSEKIGLSTAYYLLQSEQTRSAVGIKALAHPDGKSLKFCGGFLVEAFPKADEKTISIMEQVVRHLPDLGEFANKENDGLNLTELLAQLAGPFRTTIHREIEIKAFCPCSEKGMIKALNGLPRLDLEEIVAKNETLELHCEYCRKRYLATPNHIQEILNNMGS